MPLHSSPSESLNQWSFTVDAARSIAAGDGSLA
jgi:hypothetical protein